MEHIITHCNTHGVNQDTVPQDIRQQMDGTARHGTLVVVNIDKPLVYICVRATELTM